MKSNEAKNIQAQNIETGGLTHEDIEILRNPFPKEHLGVKVQSFSKDRSKAMLVLYLQHTDVMDRIEQVDPAWTSEVVHEERVGDTVYARIRLTLKGVARENVGEGGDPKSAYSDALKRAAMLFGIGRYLYDSAQAWVEYNDQRDRFKQWSVDEYERAARGFRVPSPSPTAGSGESARAAPAVAAGPAPSAAPKERKVAPPVASRSAAVAAKPAARPQTPAADSAAGVDEGAEEVVATKPGLKTDAKKTATRSRDQLNRILMNLYRPYLTKYPDTRFVELLQGRYQVGETRLMSLEQIEDLVGYMEQQLKAVA